VLLPRRGLLTALGVLLGLLALAAAARGGEILLTWDEPIQHWVEAHRTSTLDTVFLTISRFGATIPVLVLGTAAAALTWRRCRAVGVALLVATFSRPLLEFAVKALVDRTPIGRLVTMAESMGLENMARQRKQDAPNRGVREADTGLDRIRDAVRAEHLLHERRVVLRPAEDHGHVAGLTPRPQQSENLPRRQLDLGPSTAGAVKPDGVAGRPGLR